MVYNYIPIPRVEVNIERLFNTRWDILGLRRFSISGNTLGIMMMLKDALRVKEEKKM